MRGLLLTGGGARGAYQAGALMGIAKLIGEPEAFPFPVLTGMSAGAINTTALAGCAPSFAAGAELLGQLWGNLTMDQVFRPDPVRQAQIGGAWLKNLALGGFLGHDRLNALLDPRPLRALLERTLDFGTMRRELAVGNLKGVALQATHYATGASVTFLEAGTRKLDPRAPTRLEDDPGDRPRHGVHGHSDRFSRGSNWRHLLRRRLRADDFSFQSCHSSRCETDFGSRHAQGSARAELCGGSDSLRAQASHIGRHFRQPSQRGLFGCPRRGSRTARSYQPHSDAHSSRNPGETIGLRPVEELMISPSEDLGAMAKPHLKHFPAKLRYFLRGLGADQPESADFLSYILFHRGYCQELIELGTRDVIAQEAKLNRFFGEVVEE